MEERSVSGPLDPLETLEGKKLVVMAGRGVGEWGLGEETVPVEGDLGRGMEGVGGRQTYRLYR